MAVKPAKPAKKAMKPAAKAVVKAETVTLRHIGAALAEVHEMPKKQANQLLEDFVGMVTKHLSEVAGFEQHQQLANLLAAQVQRRHVLLTLAGGVVPRVGFNQPLDMQKIVQRAHRGVNHYGRQPSAMVIDWCVASVSL